MCVCQWRCGSSFFFTMPTCKCHLVERFGYFNVEDILEHCFHYYLHAKLARGIQGVVFSTFVDFFGEFDAIGMFIFLRILVWIFNNDVIPLLHISMGVPQWLTKGMRGVFISLTYDIDSLLVFLTGRPIVGIVSVGYI